MRERVAYILHNSGKKPEHLLEYRDGHYYVYCRAAVKVFQSRSSYLPMDTKILCPTCQLRLDDWLQFWRDSDAREAGFKQGESDR